MREPPASLEEALVRLAEVERERDAVETRATMLADIIEGNPAGYAALRERVIADLRAQGWPEDLPADLVRQRDDALARAERSERWRDETYRDGRWIGLEVELVAALAERDALRRTLRDLAVALGLPIDASPEAVFAQVVTHLSAIVVNADQDTVLARTAELVGRVVTAEAEVERLIAVEDRVNDEADERIRVYRERDASLALRRLVDAEHDAALARVAALEAALVPRDHALQTPEFYHAQHVESPQVVDSLRAERDAALARVAALDALLAEPSEEEAERMCQEVVWTPGWAPPNAAQVRAVLDYLRARAGGADG